MKFRKKPVVIDATQWFKHGDHPVVTPVFGAGDRICDVCNAPSHAHGWCLTLEGQHIVCVGDWIITGVKGEHYPCKPDIFAATYEPVDELREGR
jgi:hypothetical protein